MLVRGLLILVLFWLYTKYPTYIIKYIQYKPGRCVTSDNGSPGLMRWYMGSSWVGLPSSVHTVHSGLHPPGHHTALVPDADFAARAPPYKTKLGPCLWHAGDCHQWTAAVPPTVACLPLCVALFCAHRDRGGQRGDWEKPALQARRDRGHGSTWARTTRHWIVGVRWL